MKLSNIDLRKMRRLANSTCLLNLITEIEWRDTIAAMNRRWYEHTYISSEM